MMVFGPVPSRRLGCSLGINHIPPKHCPYSCVYCQVGRTSALTTTRQVFHAPEEIIGKVENKVSECRKLGQRVDYLTLVPDGEPALERNLAHLIEGLKSLKIPVAVISNASLIDRAEVQDALLRADWVSLKIDAVNQQDWRRVNRPHRRLSLPSILSGVRSFRREYPGTLVTETMLISGLNDGESAIHDLCTFLLQLRPSKAYLSIPIRPPAEAWVKAPSPAALQRVFRIFSDTLPFVDFLFEAESSDFVSTGNIADDILGITAVHPLRETALRRMVQRAAADWSIVEGLVASDNLSRIDYREETFYFRNRSSNQISSVKGKKT